VSESAQQTVRRDRRVELIAAIMLSIATVVTAWSAYQATRWSGDQTESYTRASATRTESVRSSTLAGTFDSLGAQVFLLILGAVMLAVGTVIVLTLPQNVGF
jgi:lipopolysaccharide/colanic/teichoic acid biosynthesis glycosyltransferase